VGCFILVVFFSFLRFSIFVLRLFSLFAPRLSSSSSFPRACTFLTCWLPGVDDLRLCMCIADCHVSLRQRQSESPRFPELCSPLNFLLVYTISSSSFSLTQMTLSLAWVSLTRREQHQATIFMELTRSLLVTDSLSPKRVAASCLKAFPWADWYSFRASISWAL
jgi:hypothetical protein